MGILVGLDRVSVSRGTRTLLDSVSLGVADGQRIGVVGRNGAGKSTLAEVLAGRREPDDGRRSCPAGLQIGWLSQAAAPAQGATVAEAVVGRDRPEHEWRSDPATRDVLAGLGIEPLLDRPARELSGGEQRRVCLAALLVRPTDLLILDEPTNHLDLAAIAWLVSHLTSSVRRSSAVVAVTHDRWFLDEVASSTWEVDDGRIHPTDGGYSAYVLGRLERERSAGAEAARRQNLLRRELAWLRRGAPARTSKPRYRVAAADALLAQEPAAAAAGAGRFAPPAFLRTRLGRRVLELEDVTAAVGGRAVLRDLTWRLIPGQRVGVLGPNGAGKSTLLRMLAGLHEPAAGRRVQGATVRMGYLSQEVGELPPDTRVLDAVTEIAAHLALADGSELSASALAGRFGFAPGRQATPVGELSGGERRRLQLLRLLMASPNVLLLDEPSNDLDTDTLAAVEDLLDGWSGSLVVVSHDRWLLERTCDVLVCLPGDGRLVELPGGVGQYLREQAAGAEVTAPSAQRPGDTRQRARELNRLEREVTALERRADQLERELAATGADHERALLLSRELEQVRADRERAEDAWLEASG